MQFFRFFVLFFACVSLQATASDQEIRFSYHQEKEDSIVKLIEEKDSLLIKSVNQDAKLNIVADSYFNGRDFVHALRQHKIPLAYVSSFTYYLASQKNPDLKPIAFLDENTQSSDQSSEHAGAIVTLADSSIYNLLQLQQANVGFKYPRSVIGFVYPAVYFQKILGKNLQKPHFYSTNEEALEALKKHNVDAVAIGYDTSIKNLTTDYRTLVIYKNLPPYLLIVDTKRLTPDQIHAIQQVFLALPTHGIALPYNGFKFYDPASYEASTLMFKHFCQMFGKYC